jgi:type I restriction enzyme R subunit
MLIDLPSRSHAENTENSNRAIIGTDAFWETSDLLNFEKVRVELRGLINLIIDEGGRNNLVYTNLTDEILEVKEGETIYRAFDFEDYKLKVTGHGRG